MHSRLSVRLPSLPTCLAGYLVSRCRTLYAYTAVAAAAAAAEIAAVVDDYAIVRFCRLFATCKSSRRTSEQERGET